jgi:hypothetical protein
MVWIQVSLFEGARVRNMLNPDAPIKSRLCRGNPMVTEIWNSSN